MPITEHIAHIFGVQEVKSESWVAFEIVQQLATPQNRDKNRQACWEAVLGRHNIPGRHVRHLHTGEAEETGLYMQTLIESYPGVKVYGQY